MIDINQIVTDSIEGYIQLNSNDDHIDYIRNLRINIPDFTNSLALFLEKIGIDNVYDIDMTITGDGISHEVDCELDIVRSNTCFYWDSHLGEYDIRINYLITLINYRAFSAYSYNKFIYGNIQEYYPDPEQKFIVHWNDKSNVDLNSSKTKKEDWNIHILQSLC